MVPKLPGLNCTVEERCARAGPTLKPVPRVNRHPERIRAFRMEAME
jgi:hypothetical protein